MAERLKSKDGRSETEELIGNPPEAPDKAGTDGGALGRRVGKRDEEDRVMDSPDTTTDARKSDKIATGTDTRDD
ncbi:hypothetical protein EU805_06295 [Salipiger sp. IMCC34102]|uniref:hypothetical protein n=1 Tax=Salipiger sp. IMCC34102 TaxID=2510647 RepID=UPI00101B7722|nr:hypothetical protein [Salipiger sp. IMCC34102]RYH03329.1 hypothetical protein EU805_06295 [Salipiger sp. IMCC34102]